MGYKVHYLTRGLSSCSSVFCRTFSEALRTSDFLQKAAWVDARFVRVEELRGEA